MRDRLFQNLSANSIQLLVNQLCGLVIFYLLSTNLNKPDFGRLNLVLAILLLVFNLLSFGIDQVVVRKVALGYDVNRLSSLYFFHVILSGVIFYLLLLILFAVDHRSSGISPLLIFIGAGKLMIYFSTPFKQIASGLERFKLVAIMLVVSNVVRSAALATLALFHQVTLKECILIFILGDLIELLWCYFLFKRRLAIPVSFRCAKSGYLQLLREALPQTGVVIITSAIARFDWIFIGLMVSSVKLAEYSFAYKVFELSTLPLLAIAPLLLPWFTRLSGNGEFDAGKFKSLLRIELTIAVLTVLVMNFLWVPVVDAVTDGKYGAVNRHTIFFLSLCIPFLYLNNFLWTIYFSRNQAKMILTGFIITFAVNALSNIILVPILQNEGAAIAFLAANITQTIYYLRQQQERFIFSSFFSR
ncbi:lipopolysaccharide biosynthesis protein [Flavihumibacter solisilvae]|uniref:Uncharacterized protein n=1 Tax=Flavihumibacter solisilvae TaxID=1349421 RepID=A0A0C1LEA2_9BACT|nr:oligosaccharide flippase family protein [Flavihumibacter solisilvae]KIC93768.1 hypothetical protein OI18_15475 [Flavihumibacter solisilvae]